MSPMRRSVHAELLKLTTTKMPWAFLLVLVVLGGINAATVAFGTDMDGSKTFVATAAEQQSLIEIRDTELANLRQELANIRGEVYEPPVSDDPFVDEMEVCKRSRPRNVARVEDLVPHGKP